MTTTLVAKLRRAVLQRGESIHLLKQAIEEGGITLVVGAGGTGKSAMVHKLQEQFAVHSCGKLVVTAYTGRLMVASLLDWSATIQCVIDCLELIGAQT